MTRSSMTIPSIAAALAALLIAAPTPLLAQTTTPAPAPGAGAGAPPARIGNVWNGKSHQPTAAVKGREAEAGVAAPDQQKAQQNRQLDRMGQKLIDKAQNAGAAKPPPPVPPNASGR